MSPQLLDVLCPLSEGGNLVARILLKHWESYANEKMREDELLKLLTTASEMSAGPHPDGLLPPQIKDVAYRILDFHLAGFRGIPYAREDGIPYGISLQHHIPDNRCAYPVDNNKNKKNAESLYDYKIVDTAPHSLVILGENGSGKTSVYSALEFLWLGTTSIARKHKIQATDTMKFYGNQSVPDPAFSISCRMTGNKCFRYPSGKDVHISRSLNLRNFFCSESDISMVECEGKPIVKYFNEEIGLDPVIKLSSFLNILLKNLRDELVNLTSEISGNPDNVDELTARKIKIDSSIAEISVIINALSEKSEAIRKEFYPIAQTIVTELLKDYADDYVRPAFFKSGEEKWFNGMLEWKDTGRGIDPRQYFNNFRFKLYLASIRVSIAFAIMKTKKISFPLIFDDIFDSSDFSNRLKAKPYFQNIIKLYYELKISGTPLQVIFFTQDEVIAESVYDGIAYAEVEDSNGNLYRPYMPAIFGKLFFPDEATDRDCIEAPSPDEKSEIPQLEDAETDAGIFANISSYRFKNLYDIVRAKDY